MFLQLVNRRLILPAASKQFIWMLLCTFPSFMQAQKTARFLQPDVLKILPAGAVKIGGHVGEKIDQCINNRIMVQTTNDLVELFQKKTLDPGGYRGEFIGKWATAAALSYRYQPNSLLAGKMSSAMNDLINSNASGYITTYKTTDELKVWDLWIQKYVLLGLLAQYDATGNDQYLNAAKRTTNYLLNLTGPDKLSVEEYGPAFHKGGVNYSILEPMALLYERTGEKKYLDYAEYIVASWSKPSKYTPNGVRLIENAEAGLPLVDYEVRHSYTLMSDFEGLCELYRATGKKRYLNASVKLAQAIKKYELTIAGTVSNHEMWYNGAWAQTEIQERPNETCATATWMKLCFQLLRLTGDSKWADEMETSLYNGLLGAMMPQGEWWAYDSPLYGERTPSRVQGNNLSCCVSSGPRALLLTPEWAAMQSGNGALVFNFYGADTTTYTTKRGQQITVLQKTDYPAGNEIHFTIQSASPSSFALQLRMPEWSKQTVLKVNGIVVPVKAGSYATLQRTWKNGDKVTLELDMRGRIVHAPGSFQQAVVRGPVVLALDSRLVPEQDSAIWLLGDPHVYQEFPGQPKYKYILPKKDFASQTEDVYVDLKPATTQDKNIWLAFEVSFVVRPVFHIHSEKRLLLCDFSSAGNEWSEKNLYRTWLPQPLYMNNMYARNTWKFSLYGAKVRPTVPKYIQVAMNEKNKINSSK